VWILLCAARVGDGPVGRVTAHIMTEWHERQTREGAGSAGRRTDLVQIALQVQAVPLGSSLLPVDDSIAQSVQHANDVAVSSPPAIFIQ
jgi:hypothetical protein